MQRFLADVLVGHGCPGHDEINNLVFKDRRPQLLLHLRVFLHEIKVSAFLTGVLAGLRQHGLGHFGIGHGHFGFAADFGQQQSKAHAADRKRFMLFRRLNRAVVVIMHLRVFFVPQLMRNLYGLGIHQRRWQIEFHHRIQLVQQGPLHHGAGGPFVFRLQPVCDLGLQGRQIFGAVFLGQFIVNFCRNRAFHGLHGAGENRRFAGQIFGTVFGREIDVDGHFVTSLGTDKLRLKAGDERIRPQNQRVVFRRAAVKHLAIDRAFEVDHDLIAVLGFGAFLAIFKRLR